MADAIFGAADHSNGKHHECAQAASATPVPHLVKFSGNVRDLNGKALTGVAGVTFALYKEDQGGVPLWLETQNVQLDAGGRYSIMLGATKPDGLPADLFTSGEARGLGVQPEGQAERPRVLQVSVPYALKAGDAETLGGKPASAFLQAAHSSDQTSSRTSDSAGAGPPAIPTVHGSGTRPFSCQNLPTACWCRCEADSAAPTFSPYSVISSTHLVRLKKHPANLPLIMPRSRRNRKRPPLRRATAPEKKNVRVLEFLIA